MLNVSQHGLVATGYVLPKLRNDCIIVLCLASQRRSAERMEALKRLRFVQRIVGGYGTSVVEDRVCNGGDWNVAWTLEGMSEMDQLEFRLWQLDEAVKNLALR